MSANKKTQQDTIICPHCKQETTVTAHFTRIVREKVVASVSYTNGGLEMFRYQDRDVDTDEDDWKISPMRLVCDKCMGKVSKMDFKKAWKDCHIPKKRREIDPLKRRKLEL
jgi:hypothetical protein